MTPSARAWWTTTPGSSTTRTASPRRWPAASARSRLYRELDDRVGLGEALVRLSRHRYMAGDTARRRGRGRAGAAGCCRPTCRSPDVVAYGTAYHASVLALGGADEASAALEPGAGAGRPGRAARPGGAVPELPEHRHGRGGRRRPAGVAAGEPRPRPATTASTRSPRAATPTSASCSTASTGSTSSRGAWPRVRSSPGRARLLVARLQPGGAPLPAGRCAAATGRRPRPDSGGSSSAMPSSGTATRACWPATACPPLERLLARRGAADVEALLERAWERALLAALAARARVRRGGAGRVGVVERPARSGGRGAAGVGARTPPGPRRRPAWAEVLRYGARAGLAVASFPGCPEPWAAGLRGDWRVAAAALGGAR